MTPATRRAISAAVTGFVADAASMPLHWIYDPNELASLVAGGKDPAFFSPPASKFYDYPLGNLSPYGDEIVSLAQYLASHCTFVATEYTSASYDAMKAYTGRLNGVMRDFIGNVEAGKVYPNVASDHPDTQGLNKVPLLVARFAGDPNLLSIVRDAVQVHQHPAIAIETAVAGAAILEQIVLHGTTVRSAIESAATNSAIDASIRDIVTSVLADVAMSQDVSAAINKYGKSCPLPGAFYGILFVLLANDGAVDKSIQSNILAGGDNAGRSIFIGAVTAAAAPGGTIPQPWTAATTRYTELHSLVTSIVSKNTALSASTT
ncbi:hypothetical protein H310_09537 [Aphanomyces invadans]|uniref:ADP-ribosylglycohydrolase n=1 Tax=Aphanomyces invadans TaxID=157072 RepID=A0A024TVJ4_9STRA|nr:hypothetical protein H310_09537 [Aphanomyces invadans]ETV97646.1 hypothetical protein H310_09537 [Aphanomyces invadans]RHY29804.1 hypothetical protein DYB32_005798 [Aphanomyces invadans]|eukprot:XP_008873855.1 hypothetical protein H310_09537 [Aphanomyces invadans]